MIISNLDRKDCCGCAACAEICPKASISMKRDEDGFVYPILNSITCINCGVCDLVCPILNSEDYKNRTQQYFYAATNKDRKILRNSSSGGIFSVIATYVLRTGGIVCGAAYDETLCVSHVIIDKIDDLSLLRGSKYVFSENNGVYRKLKDILNTGRYVYYTGTGCQVAGLKAYLRKDYPNLITSDIVCHGTPSPKAFQFFLQYFEEQNDCKVVSYNFRDKKFNGWSCCSSLEYVSNATGKKKYVPYNPITEAYFSAFISGLINRESCYNCPFTTKERSGDITLADYWGVEKFHSDFKFSLQDGVSFISVNTDKGKSLLSLLSEQMHLVPTNFEWATLINRNLVEKTQRPQRRDTIYNEFSTNTKNVVNEFIPNNFALRFVKVYIKRILRLNPIMYNYLVFLWRKIV